MAGTMIEDRGAEYVANWPLQIARGLHCGVGHVTEAITEVTGTTVTEMDGLSGEYQDAIGALTADQAREIIARVRHTLGAITAREATHCHYCGLPLGRDGECDECV